MSWYMELPCDLPVFAVQHDCGSWRVWAPNIDPRLPPVVTVAVLEDPHPRSRCSRLTLHVLEFARRCAIGLDGENGSESDPVSARCGLYFKSAKFAGEARRSVTGGGSRAI
jgi:hypothetical protein